MWAIDGLGLLQLLHGRCGGPILLYYYEELSSQVLLHRLPGRTLVLYRLAACVYVWILLPEASFVRSKLAKCYALSEGQYSRCDLRSSH